MPVEYDVPSGNMPRTDENDLLPVYAQLLLVNGLHCGFDLAQDLSGGFQVSR